MSTFEVSPSQLQSLADRPRTLVNQGYWFSATLMGVMVLLFAPVANRWDPATTISWVYWAIGGPLMGIAIGYYFYRFSEHVGVRADKPIHYPLGGIGITVGCFAAAALAPPSLVYTLVLLIVAAGNVVFGIIDHYAPTVLFSLGLASLSLLAWVGSVGIVPLYAIAGGFMILSGLVLRMSR